MAGGPFLALFGVQAVAPARGLTVRVAHGNTRIFIQPPRELRV